MNKRIQEIAIKAGLLSADYNGFDSNRLTKSEEKFAELLIQECIEIVNLSNTQSNSQWDKALTFAANSIKENFGIEK